jgi:hypothetical protein
MFVSSDRAGDPPAPVLVPFAAMPVELTASHASMDTGQPRRFVVVPWRPRRRLSPLPASAPRLRVACAIRRAGAEQLVALPDQRERCSGRVGMRYLADQALGP